VEIHREPGPPHSHLVVAAGRRLAVLEVHADRGEGEIRRVGAPGWRLERPPGALEWWISDDDGRPVGTLTREGLFAERFLVELEPDAFETRRRGTFWRRRWRVVDRVAGRTVVEVVQRFWSRPVHEVRRRSGDVPEALPWAIAWLVAWTTTDPVATTRRPRWTVR
jgi:hypothetical protein